MTNCYTDASYSKEFQVACYGWKTQDGPVNLVSLQNYTQGIALAEEAAHQACRDSIVGPLFIYTDHVPSKKKREQYSEVEFVHIKGHQKGRSLHSTSGTNSEPDHGVHFSQVDKAVRKQLRALIKESPFPKGT